MRTHRLLTCVAILAALFCLSTPVLAQRGRGADTSGGRGAGLPLTPSKPLKFTTDEGTWMSLDLSPDGRTIAFGRDNGIWVMNADGSGQRNLTRDGWAATWAR